MIFFTTCIKKGLFHEMVSSIHKMTFSAGEMIYGKLKNNENCTGFSERGKKISLTERDKDYRRETMAAPRWRGLVARAVLQGTGRHGLQARASRNCKSAPARVET
jgi:hypothetical protein